MKMIEMDDRLIEAIELRSKEQYVDSKKIFLELLLENPNDGIINYHFAWLHDKMGLEREAVSYYNKAINSGLPSDELRGALLGLGSTYRTLGEYDKSFDCLNKGTTLFPEAHEFKVFLAMCLYNKKEYANAMEVLLKTLVITNTDKGIKAFEDAILFYSDKLDMVWI